ncbi:flagellar filament capping protein FliD [Desulfurivibrio sp. D14AmB]|uniref:flagellar filament capping protein FliD n=1 Tax=Desulfurivibrio sp. D14AmB TaxID=3374370 RepID=UPI00376EBAC6
MSVGSISTLGVGSGLELQSILDDLRGVDERQRLAPLENNITRLESQLEAFSVLQNKLLDMRGYARNLSLETTYLARTVSSSAENVLTAAVGDGAGIQTNTIEVERLATRSSWQSEGFASRDALLEFEPDLPPKFEYQFGAGESQVTVSLELEEGTTLAQLADRINSQDNPGVTASIVDTGVPGSPYRLVLRANEVGENSRIAIGAESGVTNLGFSEQQGADGASLNAQLSIDGIVYQRQSNTIEDIFPGVSLTLQNPGTSTLSVADRTDDLRELVVGLVGAYNEVVQLVADQVRYDEESGQPGVLARTTVQGLRYELQDLMTSMMQGDESGKVGSLFDLGMEFQRDGSITLDTLALDRMLAEEGEAVRAFFLGDEQRQAPGFADRLHERLGGIASWGGMLDVEKNTAQDRVRDLEDRLASEQERLDRRYAVLTRQFVDLDRYMSQMTNMSSYLESQFDSLSSLLAPKKK